MKDYLTYRMMGEFGVDAPLCSYVYITVNGEDWGLYLAVEGIEDAFLQRNYGNDSGELYKPDSMSFGGGRGNGMDFNMDDFFGPEEDSGSSDGTDNTQESSSGGFMGEIMPGLPDGMKISENFDLSELFGGAAAPGNMGGGMSGMGSGDVKLHYSDDDPESYSNIFGNAKTDITEEDQKRLIQSLKTLSEGGDIESVVNIDEVIRYFVVHNFVVNGDSYTGSMVHNYYLYEKDGKLSMIPWDYNLAYGTFQGSDAESAVNDPIDTPLSVTGSGDRPMADWIFKSQEYTALYHRYFAEFLETVDISSIINEAAELIAPYVEKDPTAFYSYEEFTLGVETLREFCALRGESVSGQLEGTIPSTSEGQSADSANLVNASDINLSDMGSMGGIGRGGNMQNVPSGDENMSLPEMSGSQQNAGAPSAKRLPVSAENGTGSEVQPDVSGSENTNRPQNGMEPPEGVTASEMPGFSGGALENTEESFTQGGISRGDMMTENSQGSQTEAAGGGRYNTDTVLLAVSAGVLLAGVLIAWKFKR